MTSATIDGVAVSKAIHDEAWLRGEFISRVQKRGAAIIQVRYEKVDAHLGLACAEV